MRNFDPIITSVPATITELATSEQQLHIDGFDFTTSATVGNGTPGGVGEDVGTSGTPGGRSGGTGPEVKTDAQKEQGVVNDT